MNRRNIFLLACLLMTPTVAHAVRPDEVLSNTALESHAREISKELRCLVCQNESIDDSDAPLAHDLRVLLRQRLMAGDTDEAARDYIVARYGDYVLLKPPLKDSTLLLWFGPLAMLVLAIAGFAMSARKQNAPGPALTEEEQDQLAELIDKPARSEEP